MKWGDWRWAWMVVLVDALCASAATPVFSPKKGDLPNPRAVPLEQVGDRHRDQVRQVLEKPMLVGRGPAESFFCQPQQYAYFLDHPDQAVKAWRRLGAKCVSINPRGDGRFGWGDDNGSELIWETIVKGPGLRIWFAEGKVRPGPLLPLVPVKAVIVLRHNQTTNAEGDKIMHHQADLFVQTDSKTAAMMTRMLGPAAQRMTEQGLGQLQLFFSGLSWYLDRHPEHTEMLLKRDD